MSSPQPLPRDSARPYAVPHAADVMRFGRLGDRGGQPLGDRLQKVRRAEDLSSSNAFLRALAREASRSERAGDPFSVIRLTGRKAKKEDFEAIRAFCAQRLRITDEAGWLDEDKAVGILLPGATLFEARTVAKAVFEALGDRAAAFHCELYSDDRGDEDSSEQDGDSPSEARRWMGDPRGLTELFLIPMPFLKRLVDVVGALILSVFALPILLVSALAIRLESRGGVIFRQTRVGHGGKHFTLYKLRTMVDDAEAQLAQLQQDNERDGPAFKLQNDPRVTRVGKLLRKTCIDELPQLWNVLKGDMTLVGPRPPMPHEVAEYEAWHHTRLLCKGGLTCLWQIDGKPNNVSFQDWVRMDIRYQSQASPLHDLRLLFRTAWVVLSSRGDG